MMKFEVDQDLCIGCGACEGTCPEVFEIPDDKSQVKLTPVPKELQASALAAEDGCPVGAISHTE
ncbi:ferredoxin [Pontiella sp.]|uniref:ferredoxin n=1 Tax=Pontiella sp. TaxID=2837462 RepID=UPI00356A360C